MPNAEGPRTGVPGGHYVCQSRVRGARHSGLNPGRFPFALLLDSLQIRGGRRRRGPRRKFLVILHLFSLKIHISPRRGHVSAPRQKHALPRRKNASARMPIGTCHNAMQHHELSGRQSGSVLVILDLNLACTLIVWIVGCTLIVVFG